MAISKTTLSFFSLISVASFYFMFITVLRLAEFLSSQDLPPPCSEGVTDEEVFEIVVSNLLLVLLFAVQHTFMATCWWKDKMDDLNCYTIERSVYIFATAACLQLLMAQWIPLPLACLWMQDTKDTPLVWSSFFFLHFICWILIFLSCMTMDFGEMIGIKQVYYYSLNAAHPSWMKSRNAIDLMKHMRHPGSVSLLVILWVHPVMSLTRFLLATALTMYILFGFSVTEKDYCYVKGEIKRKKCEKYMCVTSFT